MRKKAKKAKTIAKMEKKRIKKQIKWKAKFKENKIKKKRMNKIRCKIMIDLQSTAKLIKNCRKCHQKTYIVFKNRVKCLKIRIVIAITFLPAREVKKDRDQLSTGPVDEVR